MAIAPSYIIEILDNSLQPITQLKAFVPLNETGDFITYSRRLSDIGECRFRIATDDPVFVTYGDILRKWHNHVRITRNSQVVWQGVIYDLPQRNRRFIEVVAATYLLELKKLLVIHDPITIDGEDTRNIHTGTMRDAIIKILDETKAKATGRAVKNMTYGTIDNPPFPAGFVDVNKNDIGGKPWTFSDDLALKFDFRDVLYVIGSFANYSYFDFELTTDMVFNFKKRFGTDKPELVFEYSQYGMIEDFNVPVDGKNEATTLIAIAADLDNNILKVPVTDDASLQEDGLLESVAAFADVKNKNVLMTRAKEDLRLNGAANSELRVSLNERAYPLGQYDLGDACTFLIKRGPININSLRQIVGITTRVHSTGREHIILNTNIPRTYA